MNSYDYHKRAELYVLTELAENPVNISLVRTDVEEYLSLYKTTSLEYLTAYLDLHATGHNAGCNHQLSESSEGLDVNGYMSHGSCFTQNYLHTGNGSAPCGWAVENLYITIESIIQNTMASGAFDLTIKEKLYERYIK